MALPDVSHRAAAAVDPASCSHSFLLRKLRQTFFYSGAHRTRASVTWAAVLAIASAAGCKDKSAATASTGGGKNGAASAVPVVVEKTVKKNMPFALEAIGAVESLRAVAIKSLVTGSLTKVNFQEGQEVQKGDLLFEIDARPFENSLRSAEADLQKTKLLLENAEAEVTRYTALVSANMVSKEQFQNLENNERSLRAALASNEAAVANAKLQLEYCTIRAPFDGRTGSLGAHEGDLVRASDPNVSLVTITQLAPIYVTFSTPQQNLPALQKYRAINKVGVFAVPADGGITREKGELTFLDSAVDPTTGTIKLKATFPNEDRGLWPGQYANIRLVLTTLPNQIVIPTTAVQNGQRGSQVFVVKPNHTVELRSVSVERIVGLETVVAKGLQEDDVVVVDGQLRLRPNVPVEIKPPVEDAPAPRGKKGEKTALVEGGNASSAVPAGEKENTVR